MSEYDNPLPLLPRPDMTPAKAVASLPQISGEAFSHVGRYAGAVVLACFEQIGGLQRMAQWADQNPTDYYTKIFGKVVQRSVSADISGTVTIDDAISRLESNSQPRRIEHIQDAEFYDL